METDYGFIYNGNRIELSNEEIKYYQKNTNPLIIQIKNIEEISTRNYFKENDLFKDWKAFVPHSTYRNDQGTDILFVILAPIFCLLVLPFLFILEKINKNKFSITMRNGKKIILLIETKDKTKLKNILSKSVKSTSDLEIEAEENETKEEREKYLETLKNETKGEKIIREESEKNFEKKIKNFVVYAIIFLILLAIILVIKELNPILNIF